MSGLSFLFALVTRSASTSSADTATVVRGDSTYVLFSRAAGSSDDRDTEILLAGDVLSRRAIAVAGGVADRVTGDAGNDVITLRGSSVTRRIDGGSGRDVIRLLSGSVAVESTLEEDGVFGGSDSDEITLSGSVVRSIVADGAGDEGDDTVFLYAGTALSSVSLGSGDDDVIMSGTARVVGGLVLGEGDDYLSGSSGTLGSVDGDGGDDTAVLNGSLSDLVVVGDVSGGGGNDILRLYGGRFDGNVLGGGGNDVVTAGRALSQEELDDGTLFAARIGGSVRGGGGDDSLTLVRAEVLGGVVGGNGNDVISASLSSISGSVDGGSGDDTATLSGVSLGGDADLGTGDDSLRVSGGVISGSVVLGSGDDTATFDGGASISGDVFSASRLVDDRDPVTGGVDSILFREATVSGSVEIGGWDSVEIDAEGSVTVSGGIRSSPYVFQGRQTVSVGGVSPVVLAGFRWVCRTTRVRLMT